MRSSRNVNSFWKAIEEIFTAFGITPPLAVAWEVFTIVKIFSLFKSMHLIIVFLCIKRTSKQTNKKIKVMLGKQQQLNLLQWNVLLKVLIPAFSENNSLSLHTFLSLSLYFIFYFLTYLFFYRKKSKKFCKWK